MRRRRSRLLRRCAAIAVVTGALAAGVFPAPQQTEAAWSEPEHAASAFTSLRLVPPQVQSVGTCARPALLNPTQVVLQVRWRWPATGQPYGSFTAQNSAWAVGGTAAPNVQTTGPDSAGVYTTSFTNGLLDGLLGSLLGQSYSVTVRSQLTPAGGQTWTSPNASTVNVNVPVLIGSPTCSFTNGT
ncbi:hypothetical protein [Georgenia alba]|uniref:Uncharacterized protein n=1 Tax=Georgenia alba TaxID=2233858 RepID=A0ABW2Q6G6_9MICO